MIQANVNFGIVEIAENVGFAMTVISDNIGNYVCYSLPRTTSLQNKEIE